MMGTDVPCVEPATGNQQTDVDLGIDRTNLLQRRQSPGDHSLIGDDDEQVTGSAKRGQRSRNVRQDADFPHVCEQMDVLNQDAVAIEKDARTHGCGQ